MKQTLYDVLGVAPDSSFEDIEMAYTKCFSALKTQTSWDSNRLVMLSEAREVLTDPGRRSAYDASLATPASARMRIQPDDEVGSRSSAGKWIVASLVLAGTAFWWFNREDAEWPAVAQPRAVNVQPQAQPQAQTRTVEVILSDSGSVQDLEEDTEVEFGLADDEAADSDDIDMVELELDGQADAIDLMDEAGGNASASGEVVVGAVGPTPSAVSIIGSWSCFEPVTGRASEYGFDEDGNMTVRRAGGEMQIRSYAFSQGLVELGDVDPPQMIAVEELSERKLILGASGQQQRLVCSR
jgi:curved DNA-binding protein CbpA